MGLLRRKALFSIALVLAAAAAPAQDPQERPEGPTARRPGQKAAEKDPKKVPSAFEMDTSEVRIRAESQSGDAAHYEFRGFVDLVAGSVRIQADKLDFYTTDKPDGTKARRIVGDGNVVFMKDEERLSGSHLDMDLDTGKGFFLDALGYIEPGVFVEGRRIERLEEKVYRVDGGKFTSCAQPNPRWMISASSATIEVDDKIVAHNALFKVKSVPALYFPLLYYPIDREGRSTGFLIPHAGTSSTRGFNIGEGFFWAISRSTDMTFYGDYYSKYGYGFGHEFRYALAPQSRGTFRTYLFWPTLLTSTGTETTGTERDYELDWQATQTLPGKVRGSLNVRRYSSQSFNQRFNDSFNYASSRSQRASLNLQRSFGGTTFQLLADSFDTYFGQESYRVNRRLPSFQVRQSPKKLGGTGLVLDYELRAERLTLGNQDRVGDYSRYDVGPELSLPLKLSFLQVNPRVGFRYTRWSASDAREGASSVPLLIGPALDRPLTEANVELRGPTFSKVFDRPDGFYTNRIKHVIGPEVNFTWRSRVDDFLSIPKFDGVDYPLGTNQVTYSLVQRLLAKRPGPGGKLVPYEFFTWRLYQTYYVKIGNNQNSFDPNYSSSAFGPEGIPDHNSPIASRIRLRPTPAFAIDVNHEYDVNFDQLRTQGYALRAGTERFGLQATWSRSRRLAENPEDRVLQRDSVRGAGRFVLLKDRLILEGSADYDILRSQLLQTSGKAQWNVQCCGFSVEYIQYNYNARVERQWRFSVQLAGVGNIGNFLGNDDRAERPGGTSPFRQY
jgi:LPS-assembly protein